LLTFGHLVISFLREELRLRSRFSPAFSLILFPQMILIGALTGYLFHPYMLGSVSLVTIHFSMTAGLFMFGITMGGLAFLGKDFIERSLGPVNMLAATAQYHPVSDRRMFAAYYIHDALFYIGLILLPLSIGISLGAIVLPMDPARFLLVLASYWTSFLLGLSLSMSMSACITHRSRTMLLMVPVLVSPLVSVQFMAGDPRAFAVPYLAVAGPGWPYLALTLLLIGLYSTSGILIFDGASRQDKGTVTWSYDRAMGLSKWIGSGRDPLMAREMVNLARGRAYLGIAFSLMAPMVVVLAFTGVLSSVGHVPFGFNSIFFSSMVSVFTVSVYTNLVNLDHLDFDQTVPLDVPMMIRAKVKLHLLISLPVSMAMIVGIGVSIGDLAGLLIGVPLAFVTVVYMGFVTAYLTGLWTNSMLFNASVFLQYIAFTILPVIYATVLSYTIQRVFLPSLGGLVLYISLAAFAVYLIDKGIERKWRGSVLASGGPG